MPADSVIGALRVVLGADSAAFEKSMNDLSDRLESIGKKIATVGAGLSAAITAPLVALAKKSFDAFEESDKAIKAVEAALKSTGNTAGFTSKQLQDMAAQLQKITTFDDDNILANVTATLLKFGNVSGSVFKDAQVAVLNLATAMHMDLQSAATLVGKALNDPVKGLSALRRAGISFTAAQTKVIEKLIATGQTARAQQAILDGFATAFGGQAEAVARTAEGKWTQAMNAIGDAMEKVGEVIAPLIVPVANFIKSMAEAFSALDPEIQRFIVYIAAAAAALGPLLVGIGAVVAAIGSLGLGGLTIIAVAIGAIALAILGVTTDFKDWPPAVQKVVGQLSKLFDATIGQITGMGSAWESFKSILMDNPIGKMIQQDIVDIQKLASFFGIAFTNIEIFLVRAQGNFTIFKLVLQELAVQVEIYLSRAQGNFELFSLVLQIWAVKAQLAFVEFLIALYDLGQAIYDFAANIASVGFDAIKTKFEDLANWIAAKAAAIKSGLALASAGFASLKTVVLDVVVAIYNGVKTWLVDKLSAAIDFVIRKVHEVQQAFKDLYEAVVGHSYVPDLVTEATQWMKTLATTMPKLAQDAVDGSMAVFSQLKAPDLQANATQAITAEIAAQPSKDAGSQGNVYVSGITIQTPDLSSFQKSKEQIKSDLSDLFRSSALRPA